MNWPKRSGSGGRPRIAIYLPNHEVAQHVSARIARMYPPLWRKAPDARAPRLDFMLLSLKGGAFVGSYSLLVMDNLGHRGAPSVIAEDVAVDPSCLIANSWCCTATDV